MQKTWNDTKSFTSLQKWLKTFKRKTTTLIKLFVWNIWHQFILFFMFLGFCVKWQDKSFYSLHSPNSAKLGDKTHTDEECETWGWWYYAVGLFTFTWRKHFQISASFRLKQAEEGEIFKNMIRRRLSKGNVLTVWDPELFWKILPKHHMNSLPLQSFTSA